MKKFLLGVLGFIVLVYVLSLIFTSSPKKSSTSSEKSTPVSTAKKVEPPSPEEEKMMAGMLETKLVDRINPELNEAFVNPITWATMKYQDKEKVSWFLAVYCGKKKGTGLNWVDIKDMYSGKKLAKYSEAWGFKTE
jgi:hypothetical protein